MDFKKEILPLVPVVAVLAPILAASFAYLLRASIEQTRVAKKVLYHLFEMRFKTRFLEALPKKQIESLTTEYLAEWKKTGIDVEQGILPEELRGIIEHILSKVMQEQAALSSDFIVSFLDSLDSFAETQPFLAFQLKGSEELGELMQNVEVLHADILRARPFDESAEGVSMEDVIKAINHESKEISVKAINEQIDPLIKSVSWKCGFFHWVRARKALMKWNKHNEFEVIDSSILVEKGMNAMRALGVQVPEMVNVENPASVESIDETRSSAAVIVPE